MGAICDFGCKQVVQLQIPRQDHVFPFRTIHILRKHIFRILGPPSSLCNHVFSTENKQKLAFLYPSLPPTSAYVIYEWHLFPRLTLLSSILFSQVNICSFCLMSSSRLLLLVSLFLFVCFVC